MKCLHLPLKILHCIQFIKINSTVVILLNTMHQVVNRLNTMHQGASAVCRAVHSNNHCLMAIYFISSQYAEYYTKKYIQRVIISCCVFINFYSLLNIFFVLADKFGIWRLLIYKGKEMQIAFFVSSSLKCKRTHFQTSNTFISDYRSYLLFFVSLSSLYHM